MLQLQLSAAGADVPPIEDARVVSILPEKKWRSRTSQTTLTLIFPSSARDMRLRAGSSRD